MSWAERAALVVLGFGTPVALAVWLLLTLVSRGRHRDRKVLPVLITEEHREPGPPPCLTCNGAGQKA